MATGKTESSKRRAFVEAIREEVGIDENALDLEWRRQPELVFKYALKLGTARLDHDSSKSYVDAIKAEIAREVRNDPTDFGISKLTEAQVKEVVESEERVLEAIEATNAARNKVEVLTAALTALEHKKRALQGLVELHAMGYFSEPKARKPVDRDYLEEEQQKRATKKVRRNG